MPTIAVVAHTRKSLGGGLTELGEALAQEGVTDPLWYEVKKSRKAPRYARKAQAEGAEVIFVWGGDGTVQRCIDAVAGTGAVLAILPAGTANLLAANLRGTKFRIRFDRPVPCELDGGDRATVRKLKIKVHPGSITICVSAA
jgi:diacylglycerol kinase family enzyme